MSQDEKMHISSPALPPIVQLKESLEAIASAFDLSPAWALVLDSWKRAALLKDRTRRAIRDRLEAGESASHVADDYDVPLEFIESLAQWQLFGDEQRRRLDKIPRYAMIQPPGGTPARAIPLGGNDPRTIDAGEWQWVKWADVMIAFRECCD